MSMPNLALGRKMEKNVKMDGPLEAVFLRKKSNDARASICK
jgi:hypothetical protein